MTKGQTKRRKKRRVGRAGPFPQDAAGQPTTESRALLGRDEEERRVRPEREDASMEVPSPKEGPVE